MFILYFASPELPKVPVSDYFEDPEHRKTSFGFELYKEVVALPIKLAKGQVNPSGLQNWRSLFFFYKTLELAKEWALLDFGIGEEWGTLELIQVCSAWSFKIKWFKYFFQLENFEMITFKACIQLENFEEVKRYSLNSFRYWISVSLFQRSEMAKWFCYSKFPNGEMVSLNLGI
ncbi:hypothetical protein GLOIN_2v1768852 [Rhizophagus irregularis DAOM 181602=DAOM 197198]|nr:hypothetical protein GLOIN_2v1768852 [Rhizophagus irregularis DAOM 181602=DAOM 197198]